MNVNILQRRNQNIDEQETINNISDFLIENFDPKGMNANDTHVQKDDTRNILPSIFVNL